MAIEVECNMFDCENNYSGFCGKVVVTLTQYCNSTLLCDDYKSKKEEDKMDDRDKEDQKRETRKMEVLAFMEQNSPYEETNSIYRTALGELLNTCEYNNMFYDNVDSVSVRQAIFIWRIVETIRNMDGKFPDDLKT